MPFLDEPVRRRHGLFTHRTMQRSRTSRSVSNSLTPSFSCLLSSSGRAISASLSSGAVLPARLARETRLAGVVSSTPKSCATCATGFPVSVTIRVAPSRNSASNFRLFSATTLDFLRSHGLWP